MAKHITSVAASAIPKVTRAEFYRRMQPGDHLYCAGRNPIDQTIEYLTKSPWSHVLTVWLSGTWCTQWLTLEATLTRGVHTGLFADYLDQYPGDLVLARRNMLTLPMIEAELDRGLSLLDDRYDWQQEVSIAARKLVDALPLIEPRNELYCSGLRYAMSLATPFPMQRPAANYPTPEDNWTDPTVEFVCALVRAK